MTLLVSCGLLFALHDPGSAAACRYGLADGISFTGLKRVVRDFDDRTRQVVDIAHNLFS